MVQMVDCKTYVPGSIQLNSFSKTFLLLKLNILHWTFVEKKFLQTSEYGSKFLPVRLRINQQHMCSINVLWSVRRNVLLLEHTLLFLPILLSLILAWILRIRVRSMYSLVFLLRQRQLSFAWLKKRKTFQVSIFTLPKNQAVFTSLT